MTSTAVTPAANAPLRAPPIHPSLYATVWLITRFHMSVVLASKVTASAARRPTVNVPLLFRYSHSQVISILPVIVARNVIILLSHLGYLDCALRLYYSPRPVRIRLDLAVDIRHNTFCKFTYPSTIFRKIQLSPHECFSLTLLAQLLLDHAVSSGIILIRTLPEGRPDFLRFCTPPSFLCFRQCPRDKPFHFSSPSFDHHVVCAKRDLITAPHIH